MKEDRKYIILFIILLVIIIFFGLNIINKYKYNLIRSNSNYHYINNLYRSDDYIYNKYLNNNEKKMYDLIIDNSINHNANILIDLDKYNCKDYAQCGSYIDVASSAVLVDHPELMNYANYSWRYKDNKFKLHLKFSYFLKYKDKYGEFRVDNALDKIEKETMNMSDKEKIKYVYNWMSNQATYDYKYMMLSENQSIYNVFVNKNAVCAGFAKSSQIIFNRIGIKSYIVQGYSTGKHMWNIVLYNGKYYYFDSTVGVSLKKRGKYFNYNGLKQSFMNSYTMTYPEWYPKIETSNMFDI